jgi:thioredoxin 1
MTLEEFKDIIKSEQKTLVKFGATWCGPCKMADRVLAKYVEMGNDRVYSIDVEDNKKIGFEYLIKSLPTFIIFQDGEIVERWTGRTTKQELIDKMK